jgi:uncharacterized protein
MSSFTLDLSQLSQGSSRVGPEAEAPEVGLDPREWPGLVRGDFQVERSGDRITVRGKVAATARLECVRCLESFELPLEVAFELYADRSGTGSRRDEVELERDDYMQFHDGRTLDLSEGVRETLLVELPMAPHCRDDCKGLCPHCGANLNNGPCACGDPATIRSAEDEPTRR